MGIGITKSKCQPDLLWRSVSLTLIVLGLSAWGCSSGNNGKSIQVKNGSDNATGDATAGDASTDVTAASAAGTSPTIDPALSPDPNAVAANTDIYAQDPLAGATSTTPTTTTVTPTTTTGGSAITSTILTTGLGSLTSLLMSGALSGGTGTTGVVNPLGSISPLLGGLGGLGTGTTGTLGTAGLLGGGLTSLLPMLTQLSGQIQ